MMKLLVGYLLYWLDPAFRQLVEYKRANVEVLRRGETVLAVKRGVNNELSKTEIGGA